MAWISRPLAKTYSMEIDAHAHMERYFGSHKKPLEIPYLNRVQLESFKWFQEVGLANVFKAGSPVDDELGGRFRMTFGEHFFKEPRLTEEECRAKEKTFSIPVYLKATLEITAPGPSSGEIKTQDVYLGTIPMMTRNGTFIINGSERVVISQILRSPGVYFTCEVDAKTGLTLATAKLIPYRGAWMVFETHVKGYLTVSVDKGKRIPVTTLLRVLGYETNVDITERFLDVDTNEDRQFIKATLERDAAVKTADDAYATFFKIMRPGEPMVMEKAYDLVEQTFFDPRRYHLESVGRFKLNYNLGKSLEPEALKTEVLQPDDVIRIIQDLIHINNGNREPDDVDHLFNRRVRPVGELLRNSASSGFFRMSKAIRESMESYPSVEDVTPAKLMSPKAFESALYDFFISSQTLAVYGPDKSLG